MLAEQWRAFDRRGRVRQLDRHADIEPLAALRVIELDPHVAPAHVLVVGQVLGRHDRAAGYVERIEDCHQLALGVPLRELVDQRPHELLILAALADGGEVRVGREVGHAQLRADALRERGPDGLLDHDVEPVVRAVRLAVNRVAELTAARVVARARHLSHAPIGGHRIFGQIAARQPLVIAELDAAKVHHAVHHRHLDVLADARALGLPERREQADREMQPRSRVADLRAGDERRTVGHAGGAHRAAHGLRDVLVGLEIGVRPARSEALDRAQHDLRVDLADLLPRKAEAVEHARSEILHDDVALLEEVDEHLLALGRLHVHGDRALVAVEHREVKAVGLRHVAQLAARRVSLRILELDHVGAHPGEQLRAGWPSLDVRHVEDAYAFQSFHSDLQYFCGYFFFALGFRLVMRPLSVPAPSSMTALMSVGLRERMASSIALRSSAGVVACTPTPPKASISFS